MERKIYIFIVIAFILITIAIFSFLFWDKLASYKDSKTGKNQQTNKILENTSVEAVLISQQFANISAKNKEKIIENYSKDITISWEGNFLDGEYEGMSASQEFWDNFFNEIIFNSTEINNINYSEENKKALASVVFYNKRGGQNEKLEKIYEIEIDAKSGKIKRESWIDNDDKSNINKEDEVVTIEGRSSGEIDSISQDSVILKKENGESVVFKLTLKTEILSDFEKQDGYWTKEDLKVGQKVFILFDNDSKEIITLFITG